MRKELAEKIKGVSILGIRSKTQVTAKVLENADRLMAIGAFALALIKSTWKQLKKKELQYLMLLFSNTRSVVELAIGEIINADS